jgi:cell division protein ZapD
VIDDAGSFTLYCGIIEKIRFVSTHLPYGAVISYDFPLNERIRTLLRLEDLYAKMAYFSEKASAPDHHSALSVMFEIMEVASRADLKSDLIQELERQKRQLAALHNNPGILEEALDAVLEEIENTSDSLFQMNGKIGQHLRDNEWLMAIKQRACIPGGTCEFDLPSYHYWLHQDATSRRNYLNAWIEPMMPIRDALDIILKLLRESGKLHAFTAHQGSFQQMQGGRISQLLRITLDSTLPCIPEVSANKYVLNIRFVTATYAAKSTIYDQDVNFNLTFCSL